MSRGMVARVAAGTTLGDGNVFGEIDVLNGIEQCDAIRHRPLERFPSRNEPCPTCAFVDDRGPEGLFQITVARGGATRVDESGSAHIAVRDLVAREIDGVFTGQRVIDILVGFTEIQGSEATVGVWELLLDDVCADRDPEVVGLASQVSGCVKISGLGLERGIT